MPKYIKVEDACKEIDRGDLLVGNNADWAKEILYRTKSADVREITYGEWVDAWGNDKCTVCGFECGDPYYLGSAKYCPECGAKMKSREKSNESVR
jgi:hypothetical protein